MPCPFCGSITKPALQKENGDYRTVVCDASGWVVVPKGTGYYKTDFCECCGCSAMFRKPELFTMGRGRKANSIPEDGAGKSKG
jgi:hypothetical protein